MHNFIYNKIAKAFLLYQEQSIKFSQSVSPVLIHQEPKLVWSWKENTLSHLPSPIVSYDIEKIGQLNQLF